MGASPDAMLVFRQADGKELGRLAVECKAPCPFKPKGNNTWTFLPGIAGWQAVPAPYFAQCQLVMLATNTMQTLLLQYLPTGTKVFKVDAELESLNGPDATKFR